MSTTFIWKNGLRYTYVEDVAWGSSGTGLCNGVRFRRLRFVDGPPCPECGNPRSVMGKLKRGDCPTCGTHAAGPFSWSNMSGEYIEDSITPAEEAALLRVEPLTEEALKARRLMRGDSMRKVLVIGGTRGIGLAIARHFKRAGNDVMIAGRDGGNLDDACNALQICGMAGDVSIDASFMIRRADEDLGGLNIVINTAGVSSGSTRAVVDVNVIGAASVLDATLSYTKAKHIVLFAGGGVGGPNPGKDTSPIYAASKAAVVQLAECHAARNPGVQINAVAPGRVATDMTGGDGAPPDKAVALVAWLCSEAGAHVTGRLVSVRDGDLWDAPLVTSPALSTLPSLPPGMGKLRREMPGPIRQIPVGPRRETPP